MASFRLFFTVVVTLLCCPKIVDAQLEFSDLEAGYKQNQAAFENSSFRLRWRNSVERDSRWNEAVRDLVSVLSKARIDSKQRISYDMILNFYAPPPGFIESVYEKYVGLFEYFNCADGKRFRASWGIPQTESWGDEDLESKFVDETSTNHYTYTIARPGEFVVNGLTETAGDKTFTVYPIGLAKSELLFFDLSSPLNFNFVEGKRCFNSVCDFLYPPSPDDSRIAAEFKVSVKGNLAIVEIEEKPSRIVSDDGKFKTGFRVYAEVDMSRGFLPTIIKSAQIGSLADQKLTGAADSFWSRVIRFKIGELEGVGFYPEEAVEENFIFFPESDQLVETIEEKGLFGYLLRGVSAEKPESAELFCELRKTSSVVECGPWHPANSEQFFSLDEPEGVDRVNDRRKGDFHVNKSIEHSSAMELDSIPDAAVNRTAAEEGIFNKSMIQFCFWLTLSLSCIGYFYWRNR